MSLGENVRNLARGVGALRLMLFGYTLITLLFTPAPGTTPIEHNWRIIPTLLIPLSIPVLWIALVMDAFMARLLMLEHKKGMPERIRLRRLAWLDLLLALLLVLFWLSYFRAIH